MKLKQQLCSMSMLAFWVVMPCELVCRNQHSAETLPFTCSAHGLRPRRPTSTSSPMWEPQNSKEH